MRSYVGLFCFTSLLLGLVKGNDFIATSDCVCVGQDYTYQCSVTGGELTVWSGSVIGVGCEIILFHNQYESPNGASGECNNGAVTGRSIEVVNNSYTSQLTIRVTANLNGRTIECLVDDGIVETTINSSTLFVTKVPFSSPTNVRLIEASPTELIFNWVPPSVSCPYLTFYIEAENCGICQNSMILSNVTCSHFTLSTVCTLKVYSVVCGNFISSDPSNTVSANLSVPNISSILTTPYYSDGSKLLTRVETIFSTAEPFNISSGINGSVTSYIIVYSDTNTGSMCGSRVIIPDASCEGRLCRDVFNISSSLCPPASDITTTVIVTNIIGEVPVISIRKAGTNNLVNVNFISSTRSIECTFLNKPQDSIKMCSANLTYGASCDVSLGVYSSAGLTNRLRTPIISFLDDVSDYCFTITASSGSETVIIEGTLNVIVNPGFVDTAPIVVALVLIVIILGAVALVSVITLTMWYRYEPPTPATIRFSNEDKPGSLATMLKVFKDHNVNILRINTHWIRDDLKRTFRTRWKENFLYILCTEEDKTFLGRNYDINFLDELSSQEESEGKVTAQRPTTAVLHVCDRPGALYEVLRTFGGRNIDILGLNTRCNHESIPYYKDNYVSCSCSERKLKLIEEALVDAGAKNTTIEFIVPSQRRLQFYVRDEVGSLVKALKVFRDLNINITSINSTAPEVSGPLTHIVECRIKKSDHAKLFRQLASSAGATKVKECKEVFGAQSDTENETESDNYLAVEFTLRNEVGSLVAALEVFHTLHINIMSVNTQKKDPKYFNTIKEVNYKYIEIDFDIDNVNQEQKLVEELQATGMVIKAELEESDPDVELQSDNMSRKYHFAIRDEAEALSKALLVFDKLKISNARIQDLHLNPSFKYTPLKVQYKLNHVEFVSTPDQETKLKLQLQATGLAVDVKSYDVDDLQGSSRGDHISSSRVEIGNDDESEVHNIVAEFKSHSSSVAIDLLCEERGTHLKSTTRKLSWTDVASDMSNNLILMQETYYTYIDEPDEVTHLTDTIDKPVRTGVATGISDGHGLMQEIYPYRNKIQQVHQSTYFETAENIAHVPFLDHQMLECDCNGREYTNVDHDITLRIPEGAVAKGEKIHFEVGVAMYGPFHFPENTKPISPILWLCILEEGVELKKPFQIILPHYLTGVSKERIEHHQVRFAKANHNDYTIIGGQIIYKFQHCITEPQILHASSGYRNYGILVSKHCCFYCLQANETHELTMETVYCLVRIESDSSLTPGLCEIYFSAIFFLDTCLRSLEEQFPREGFKISHYKDFTFKESDATQPSIKLTIPNKPDQYDITLEPINAKIKASDIDFGKKSVDDMRRRHERKMYPPRIKMIVSLNNPDIRIKLPVRFSGYVGEDEQELDVDLILPIGFSPVSRTSSWSSRSQNTEPQSRNILLISGKPELKDAFRELIPLATHWKTIGTLLGVPGHILEKTRTDESTTYDQLQKMLSEWLNQIDSPTWKTLVDVVEIIDKAKAQDIRKRCF